MNLNSAPSLSRVLAVSLFAFGFSSCGDLHMPVPVTNLAKSDQSLPSNGSKITFKNSIQTLFQNRCGTCHNSGSMIPNWTNFETAFSKRDLIYKRAVVDRTMPPKPIPQAERDLIAKWIEAGAPQGDAPAPEPTQTETSTPEPSTEPSPSPSPSESPSPEPSPSPLPGLTYSGNIQAIFKSRCSMCHNENWPIRNWQDYQTAVNFKDAIMRRAVVNRDMPPGNITGIVDGEISDIKTWIEGGTPQ